MQKKRLKSCTGCLPRPRPACRTALRTVPHARSGRGTSIPVRRRGVRRRAPDTTGCRPEPRYTGKNLAAGFPGPAGGEKILPDPQNGRFGRTVAENGQNRDRRPNVWDCPARTVPRNRHGGEKKHGCVPVRGRILHRTFDLFGPFASVPAGPYMGDPAGPFV